MEKITAWLKVTDTTVLFMQFKLVKECKRIISTLCLLFLIVAQLLKSLMENILDTICHFKIDQMKDSMKAYNFCFTTHAVHATSPIFFLLEVF